MEGEAVMKRATAGFQLDGDFLFAIEIIILYPKILQVLVFDDTKFV